MINLAANKPLMENQISAQVVDICIKVHKTLGPGLLESIYEEVICMELANRNIPFERQKEIKAIYEGKVLGIGFRADVIVNKLVIIEIKSVQDLSPVHSKQLLTYLKLTNLKLGLLINFNVELIKNGIHRVVNKL